MTARRYRYDARKVLALGERLCLADGFEPNGAPLAAMLGVSRRQVTRWRTGETASVRPSTVDRIEKQTGVNVSTLEHTS